MTLQLPSFGCLFLSCQQQKDTKNRAAVTSLRSFLFYDNFSKHQNQYMGCRLIEKDFFSKGLKIKSFVMNFISLTSVTKNWICQFCHNRKIRPKGNFVSCQVHQTKKWLQYLDWTFLCFFPLSRRSLCIPSSLGLTLWWWHYRSIMIQYTL